MPYFRPTTFLCQEVFRHDFPLLHSEPLLPVFDGKNVPNVTSERCASKLARTKLLLSRTSRRTNIADLEGIIPQDFPGKLQSFWWREITLLHLFLKNPGYIVPSHLSMSIRSFYN